MNTKYNKRAIRTKHRIQKAYLEILQKKDKVTVKEICDKSNINRSTFYAHYLDIYDLIDKIQLDKLKEIENLLLHSEYVGFDNMSTIFETIFQFIKDNKVFYSVFLDTPHISITLNVTSHEPLKYMILNAGKKLNYKSEKEIEYHLAFFLSGFGSMIRLWLLGDCTETPKTMARMIEDEYKKIN